MSNHHAQGLRDLRNNRFADAARNFAAHLKFHSRHAPSVHYLGVALGWLGDFHQARRLMEASVHMSPRQAEFHHNLASTYRVLGQSDEAEKAYRTAIALKPDYAEAYFNLASVRRFPDGQADLDAVERLLTSGDLKDTDREFAHFAAGKFADDLGESDRAFQLYQDGNNLRARSFDRAHHERLIDRLETVFSASTVSALPTSGEDSGLPIFVVGMPRSGTTLVEQVLASHPKVHGAGELPDIMSAAASLSEHANGAPYPENISLLPAKVFSDLARQYLRMRQPLLEDGAAHIVDKMPGNFLHLGLIASLFPKARVIHCLRDPRNTCLSCYFQRFRTGHEYTDRLDDLAFFYRSYERMMRHWHKVCPLPILDLRYEDLIANQEGVTRRLLEFCDLDWDEACLRFHETERPVSTASSAQVRQPLNRRGLERWARYEKHLGPLLELSGRTSRHLLDRGRELQGD